MLAVTFGRAKLVKDDFVLPSTWHKRLRILSKEKQVNKGGCMVHG